MASFLDAQTLKLIQDTAAAAVGDKVDIRPMPNNPEMHLMVHANGKVEHLHTPHVAQPRCHTVETIESFAQAFARWRRDGRDLSVSEGDDGTASVPREPNIWVNMARWTLKFFADEPIRRSTVTLVLTPSLQLLLLQTFKDMQTYDQRRLVRMLRHDLAGCVDLSVLSAFRTMDFQKAINMKRQIETSRQSLDSDIVAQVGGEKKPEAFSMELPLFAMRELASAKTRVTITVDIDVEAQRFELQARPGDLDLALDDARAAVLSVLEAELNKAGVEICTILHGSPS